ncbi:MAG: hypothetical protein ACP6IP_02925 [Candidatus Njordarchaeia archaeon]
MNKKLYKNKTFLIYLIIIIISVPASLGLSILVGLLFFISMLIGTKLIFPFMNKILMGFYLNEIIASSKFGSKLVSLPDEFERKVSSIDGQVSIIKDITLLNFLALLLITKYITSLGISGVNLYSVNFLIGLAISILATMFITPISFTLFTIESLKYRVFNEKKAILDYPAYMYRRLFKGIFGFGNLLVLIWIFIDAIKLSQLLNINPVIDFLVIIFISIGSILIGATFLATVSINSISKSVDAAIDSISEKIAKYSITSEEFLEIMENMLKKPKEYMEEVMMETEGEEREKLGDETVSEEQQNNQEEHIEESTEDNTEKETDNTP